MSSIRIKPEFIKGHSTSISSMKAKVSAIEKGVTSVRSSIDSRILARSNINAQLKDASNSLHTIERELHQLQALIIHSMDRYSATEAALISKSMSMPELGQMSIGPNLRALASLTAFNTGKVSPTEKNVANLEQGKQISRNTGTKGYWNGKGYLLGDEKSHDNGISASGGVGYYEYDWAGLNGFQNGHFQIGGSGKFSGINGQVGLDTKIVDVDTNMDMLTGEGTASVGGKSFFPLAKAEAKVLGFEGRTSFDEEIPMIGNFGAGGKADILSANAFAGIDNNTAGIGAKASLAEAEGNLYIPIPFTDYNFKLIGGVSAGGAGGEIKVGAETSLDIRVLVGIKLGFGFEKQD